MTDTINNNKWIIETERLGLREMNPATDGINAFQLNIDPEVLRYTGDLMFESVAAATHFLRQYTDYAKNGFGRWAVMLKETGEFLGWCGLKKHEDGMIDLGFRFKRKFWNKGYASESAQACVHWAFENNLDTLVGRVAQENIYSIRVLEKMGFQFWKEDECEGILDSLYYRLHRPEKALS